MPIHSIPLKVFHRISPHIMNYIYTATSNSLTTGNVPQSLKTAIITPIIKKAWLDHDILSNYRHIFQLSTLSKIPEKIVPKQITNNLINNSLLNECQSAYLQGKTTETALTLLSNDILTSLDNDKPPF